MLRVRTGRNAAARRILTHYTGRVISGGGGERMTVAPIEGAGAAPAAQPVRAERRRTPRDRVEIPLSFRSTLRVPPTPRGRASSRS